MLKESKLIEELKREYDEKLKKLRQKEKENKERIYKKLSSALFKDFEINEDFKNEFNLSISKQENFRFYKRKMNCFRLNLKLPNI
ncbi:hypothetical protein JGS13_001471 [Campylobacter coli]|nr:hypothetical protein [Campylobacter coli]